MEATKTHSVVLADAKELARSRGDLSYAWFVVFVLTVCCTLSFVDRQILSLLVGPIKRDLGISDTRIGMLQGFAFALFYTIMGLPIGRIVDTRNRRNLIAFGIIIWTGFASLCSVARSFASLFLARVGVGVGEASLSPAAYSIISDYFPPDRLGVALSIYYMGVFFGASLALIVGGTVVNAVTRVPILTLPVVGTVASWRLTFLIDLLPGLLFAAIVFITVREPVRRNLLRNVSGEARKLSLGEVVAVLRSRWQSVAGISLGMISASACSYAFLGWAPTFFVRVHGWTPGQAGRALGPIVLCACLGMYVGGRLCQRWQRRGITDAPLRVAVPSAIGVGVFFPLAMTAHSATWTLLLACPALFFLAFPTGTAVAAIQLIFPNQVRGQASALYLFLQNIGGLSLGPLLPGLLNDYVFHDEKMIGVSLAVTIGMASMVTLVVFLATMRPYRQHYGATQAENSTVPIVGSLRAGRSAFRT